MFKILMFFAGFLLVAPVVEAAGKSRNQIRCYSSKDTRDRIARLKLANPLILLRAAARRYKAQPLRSALCRRRNILMYRFLLLRRDGKVVRTYVNARNGRYLRVTTTRRRSKQGRKSHTKKRK